MVARGDLTQAHRAHRQQPLDLLLENRWQVAALVREPGAKRSQHLPQIEASTRTLQIDGRDR